MLTPVTDPPSTPALQRPDALDVGIIELLEEDGRMPAAQMAERLGVSDDVVRERLRVLRETEMVQVLGCLVPSAQGLPHLVVLGLQLRGDVRPTLEQLAAIDEIIWLSCVDGRFDVFAELTCRDAAQAFEIVNERIRSIEAVLSCEVFTHLATTTWREAPGATNPHHHDQHAVPRLDEVDIRLAELLTLDGRATYRELSQATGISYDVVRRRVPKLIANGALQPVIVVDRRISGRSRVATVGIKVSGPVPPVLELVGQLPDVNLVYFTTGSFDIICSVACRDIDHLAQVVGTQLREIPGVATTETFNLLHVAKRPPFWAALPPTDHAAAFTPTTSHHTPLLEVVGGRS